MANVKIGNPAPSFELPAVDGEVRSLAAISEGKRATAVVFMCNHCPYVLAWMDRLVAASNDYAGDGVAFVAINSNDAVKYPADSFDAMATLAAEYSLPFPYLHDETQQVAEAYGAERTPEVFLFDAGLELRYHGAPDDNYDEAQAGVPYLRDALDAVLAGGDPATQETPPAGCTIKWK
ncbi:thioredoxin family protein [Chloroflexota bacterium]